MREYEKARRTRLPDTGDYLVDSTLYQTWKGSDITNTHLGSPTAVPAMPQMLVIKGYPLMPLLRTTHTNQKTRQARIWQNCCLLIDH